MSFGSVCTCLLRATARNLAVQQARRLRSARYAVPAVLAAVYLGWAIWSNPLAPLDALPWAADIVGHAESILTWSLAAMMLAGWVLGEPKPRLVFTEPEIQFLFAAPLTRRQLVHYRLVKDVLLAGLTALLPTLLFGRASGGSAAALWLASWVALSTVGLHFIGASFARAWLHERLEGLPLRAIQLATLTVAAASAWGPHAPLPAGGSAPWLLWPAQAVIRPIVTHGPGPFAGALLLALAVLALHYGWVLVAADGFEDAAVETAARTARRLEALRTGGVTAIVVAGKTRSVPFRLPGSASPEVAIAWKGMIAITRSRVFRLVAIGVVISVAGAIGISLLGPDGQPSAAAPAGLATTALLVLVALMGPLFTGGGVSGDLNRLDFVRALPLSGARIVLGQALAPAFLLSALWVVLVPVAAVLLPVELGWLERGCAGLSLIIVGPPMLLLGVLLQAALVLVVPGWATAGAGLLGLGRMMLAYLVQIIGFPILALPAGLLAATGVAVARPIIGWSALPAFGLLAALVLVLEIALALLVLGRLFEKLDPGDL